MNSKEETLHRALAAGRKKSSPSSSVEKVAPEVIFSAKGEIPHPEVEVEGTFTELPSEVSRPRKSIELPKRPAAPHLRFFQEIAAECAARKQKITLSEAMEIWKGLKEEDKEPYLEEYKKEQEIYKETMKSYRASLDYQGVNHKTVKKFTTKKIKKILELNNGLHQKRGLHKERNANLFYTLRTAVALFLQDMGKEVQEYLENKGKDVVTVEALDAVLDKKFSFITESHLYPLMLDSLIDPRSMPKPKISTIKDESSEEEQ
eukprot:TRINITY_DN121203_c0_g1_i1.p1 TRINITY_DN121203_c0_g1~~TRINITY_DN121203_c0_g1_i1.p1  ORF type:complete len:288 (-),score=39.81 TRINITY_DN121203_c0_g1_i1:103-885(-)